MSRAWYHSTTGDPAEDHSPHWIDDYPLCPHCDRADTMAWPTTNFADYGIEECNCIIIQFGDGTWANENELMHLKVACTRCHKTLPPHTYKQHLDPDDPIHQCPHEVTENED